MYQGTLNFKFSSIASRELHQRECLSSFIISPHSSGAGRFVWYSPKLRINWPFTFRIQYCLNQNLPNCLLPKLKKASPECFIVERYMHSFDTVDSQSHASSLIKVLQLFTKFLLYRNWSFRGLRLRHLKLQICTYHDLCPWHKWLWTVVTR